VRIAPYVAAGHLKTVPLWPDDETLRLLATGEKLTDGGTPPTEPPAPPAPTNPETPAAKKKLTRAKRKKLKERSSSNGATQTRP
jgi:hypothetical protein